MTMRRRLYVRRVYNRYHSVRERIRDRLVRRRPDKPLAKFVFSSACRQLFPIPDDYRCWVKHLHQSKRKTVCLFLPPNQKSENAR